MKPLVRVILGVTLSLAVFALTTFAYPSLFQSGDNNQGTPTPSTTPKNLQGFYDQKPLWSDCEGNNTEARCGFIQVPLNWNKPEEGAIQLAVAINPAADPKNSPYLLMNPGGPGSSGHEWITDYLDSLGTPELRNEYNVVGFDPRGVGKSTAVKCSASDEGLYKFFYDQSPYEYGSEKDLQYTKQSIKYFGEACLEYTGELLGHIDTSSAAKDMDIIRSVLGSEKLNYLGFSTEHYLVQHTPVTSQKK